jgi:hypothetical protein
MIGLLILPSLLLVVRDAPLPALVLTGAASVIAVLVTGQAINFQARIPVQPVIGNRWLQEIGQDITDAALLAVLRAGGIEVDAKTAEAGAGGWNDVRFVAAALDRLDAGPAGN